MATGRPAQWATAFQRVESYARSHDYAGHDKFDALNSRAVEAVFGATALGRLLVTQFVNRVPLPLRDILRVRRERNPKGIANFVRAYANAPAGALEGDSLAQIRTLADWLLDHDSAALGAYSGPGRAWGYQFPWQSPGFFAPRHSPNCIVTTFVGEALLSAFERTRDSRYLDAAQGVRRYILEALPVLEQGSDTKCIGYVASGPRWKVININAVAGGFLAKLARGTSDASLGNEARRLVAWTVAARNADDSWNYTSPRSQSGIGPDNYHTGGILDGIWDYGEASRDRQFEEVFWRGLAYYEERFFTASGAARWRASRTYPVDIHGLAQGIITFSRAARKRPEKLDVARRIAGHAVERMQDPAGFFYYQRFRTFTWKLNLMRWCNSWMMMALAELLAAEAVAGSNQVRAGHAA